MKLNPGFFAFHGTNPTQAEWISAIGEYERHEQRGLTPNEIAPLMGVSKGTACRLWSLNRELRGIIPEVRG